MASVPLDCEMKSDTDEENFSYADEVKSRLLHVFQKMTDKITSANFNEIFNQFEESGAQVTNVDEIVQEFKVDLHQNICENFKDMWHCNEISIQLNVLNYLKEKCKNNHTSWRPTEKTPEEQTKYLRIHYLNKKIDFIKKALKQQDQSLNEVLGEVSDKRAIVQQIAAQREMLSNQIDIRMEQIDQSDSGANQRLQRDFGG